MGLKLPDSIPDLLLDSDAQNRMNSVTIYQKSDVQRRREKKKEIQFHPSMRVERFRQQINPALTTDSPHCISSSECFSFSRERQRMYIPSEDDLSSACVDQII